MSSLTGDGAPKELRDAADKEESTQVDPTADDVSRETSDPLEHDRLAAIRSEIRAAYLDGVMDEHSPLL